MRRPVHCAIIHNVSTESDALLSVLFGLDDEIPVHTYKETASMFKIVDATFLSQDVKKFRIIAPRIAHKQKAGQFVILRVNEHGERIPITIADSDPEQGTVTIIVQGIGKTTKMLNCLQSGDHILDVVGPLGRASDIRVFGNVAVVGGGVGTAIAYPIARALHEYGNHVTTIIGAKTKSLVILRDEMAAVSDASKTCTDDGTLGSHGFVTASLLDILHSGRKIDYVFAVGPIPMMSAVAETTRPLGIETVVSLNAIMVDGTGMCGGCRVTIAGKNKFACVDGPEFDAHQVDFNILQKRIGMYKSMERSSLDHFLNGGDDRTSQETHNCRLTGEERVLEVV
jgi:ferredoxin--NADP+ reductase